MQRRIWANNSWHWETFAGLGMVTCAGIIPEFRVLKFNTTCGSHLRSSVWVWKSGIYPSLFLRDDQNTKISSFITSVATNMAIDEKNVTRLNEPNVEELGDSGVTQLKPQKKWTSYLLDTFGKSPKERRFLFEVDAAILTFASLGTCLAGLPLADGFKN